MINTKNNILLFFIYFLINFSFSNSNPYNYEIEINKENSELDYFYINDDNNFSTCNKWIPSLFTPVLLIPRDIEPKVGDNLHSKFDLINPLFYSNNFFPVDIYDNIPFLKQDFYGSLVRSKVPDIITSCYLGLSPGIDKYGILSEDNINLNKMKKNGKIKEKIFSFDMWDIKTNIIKLNFYLGESHEVFSSNKGITGFCKSYDKDVYWGCSFKKMIFNNLNVPLKKSNGEFYKIYFASEIYNIIFPISFKKDFEKISNESCKVNEDGYLECKNFFNSNEFVPLELTEENDNIIITGQVDNINRFNKFDENKINYARIKFQEIEFIILPLSIFKQFHIQFNFEKNEISFYTNNSLILKTKESQNNEGNNSSSFLTVLLIVLIILILLLLGYGLYWFIIKRKGNVEKDINKFNKFEEEESFHNMNENRVF